MEIVVDSTLDKDEGGNMRFSHFCGEKRKTMDSSKSQLRLFYEEVRLLTKDTIEAVMRLKRICANSKTHYVFVNDHIGDVIISLGYLNAFRNSKDIEHITLVVTSKYKELVSVYSDVYEAVICIEPRYLYRIFLLNLTRFGELYIRKKHPNVTFVNPADSAVLGFDYLKHYPEMNLEKMIKFGCLELSNDAEFLPPTRKNALVNLDKHNRQRVLISLDSRTVEVGQVELYEKLICELEEREFEVYTNTEYKDDCLGGSKPFYGSLSETRELLQDGVLIGVRSGLHDLAMYQDCKVVAIYPKDNKFGSLFDLGMLPKTRASYLEVNQSENINSDCKAILDFIKG